MPRQTGVQMRLRIEHAIAELTAKNNRPPTNREIGQYLGGKSTGHIDYHLRYMREQGIISHEPRKSRGITLLKPSEGVRTLVQPVRIPLAGRIAAGQPIEANMVTDEYIDLAEGIAQEGEVYALKVKGTSMIEDHIDDGDIVIVRRQTYASNGDTVVAQITTGPGNWEATLKRFYRERDGKIRLQPRNAAMEPIIVSETDLEIQGKVIAVLRQV
jgi:repressor LexA